MRFFTAKLLHALTGLAPLFCAQAALAQEAAALPANNSMLGLSSQVMPFVLMFGVLYLLLIRPQQKKVSEHKKLLSELRRGDKVVTSGGIIGTISKLEGEDIAIVEIATDVKVRIAKTAIASVLTRTQPGEDKAAND